jgi:hypothetical protein
LDKVTTTADMLKHERKDLCLPWNTLDGIQNVFPVCEIERIAHSDK